MHAAKKLVGSLSSNATRLRILTENSTFDELPAGEGDSRRRYPVCRFEYPRGKMRFGK